MSTGAQRYGEQPEDGGSTFESEVSEEVQDTGDFIGPVHAEETESQEEPAGRRWLAVLLTLLGIGWTATVAWVVTSAGTVPPPAAALQWVAVLSGPLILLALLWLLFGRAPRREAERFSRAVAAMHGESAALETMLSIVANRLEENHSRLTNEAAKLMSLGDEASDRLGRVTYYLSKEAKTLDARASALEAAAAAAKVDIGILLEDLPRAEEQARTLGISLRETGLAAHEQAGALESQVASLAARGREADDTLGGTAQRLAAHIARIDTNTAAAAARIEGAAAGIGVAIDGTMERAAEAVEASRAAVDQQGAALLALIEQSRAAFKTAGDETGHSLAGRLGEIEERMQSLTGQLAAQDAASQALVDRLGRDLAELDGHFAALREVGGSNAAALADAVENLRGSVGELTEAFSRGEQSAGELTGRARDISDALADVGSRLDRDLPAALGRVEEQARQADGRVAAIAPRIEAIEAAAAGAAASLAGSEASVGRQGEALDAMLAIVADGIGGAEERLQALAAAVAEADEAAARIVGETSPELVAALVRVRETAHQAAERAREAIAVVIPESAAALGHAARRALGEAITGEVETRIDELGALAERAVEAGRSASEGLTRQMLSIGRAASAVEERIEDARRRREESDSEAFSRRVALLIESLNSTAIDVTKILSNEVTDSAWSAYLKGDRGVFTRRAVRLLDATETREIVQHYESEPEFREQVNRYVADFEAMLRRVLAEREGTPLGVTLLSSDMGKLYVALAQAIERIRT